MKIGYKDKIPRLMELDALHKSEGMQAQKENQTNDWWKSKA